MTLFVIRRKSNGINPKTPRRWYADGPILASDSSPLANEGRRAEWAAGSMRSRS